MKLSVLYLPSLCPSSSPYRLFDDQGHEIAWANAFLDAKRLLRRSDCSLRAYAFDLLNFARWAHTISPHDLSRTVRHLSQSTLQDYLRYQLDRQPPPAPQTINRRLDVVRSLHRFHLHDDLPGHTLFPHSYTTRSPLGYGRPRRLPADALRLPQPHRIIQPLSVDDVARFWKSFRTFRDLALVGLMLHLGLRAAEVLAIQLPHLHRADRLLLVSGKGNKQRLLPVTHDLLDVLDRYLALERPPSNSSSLFLQLKGPSRGLPLTYPGLRSLFRYHRAGTQVPRANPHRFRHTFGADMVRAGISLPALQKLMGHAQIRTTMLYIQIAPQDVWQEYHRAIQKRIPPEASF